MKGLSYVVLILNITYILQLFEFIIGKASQNHVLIFLFTLLQVLPARRSLLTRRDRLSWRVRRLYQRWFWLLLGIMIIDSCIRLNVNRPLILIEIVLRTDAAQILVREQVHVAAQFGRHLLFSLLEAFPTQFNWLHLVIFYWNASPEWIDEATEVATRPIIIAWKHRWKWMYQYWQRDVQRALFTKYYKY